MSRFITSTTAVFATALWLATQGSIPLVELHVAFEHHHDAHHHHEIFQESHPGGAGIENHDESSHEHPVLGWNATPSASRFAAGDLAGLVSSTFEHEFPSAVAAECVASSTYFATILFRARSCVLRI